MRGGAGGRGGRGGRGGASSNARGFVPNQPDLAAETGKDLGLYSIYQVMQMEKPAPVYPERSFKQFNWSSEEKTRGEEQMQIEFAKELREWFPSSAFNIDSRNPDAGLLITHGCSEAEYRPPMNNTVDPPLGPASGAKRLFASISDILYTHLFPADLMERPGKRKSKRLTRDRGGSFSGDLDALEKKEQAADTANDEEGEIEEGAPGTTGAPRRRADSGDDEANLSEEELEEEEDEDFNDYAEDYYREDDEDYGDDNDGDREAEY